MHKFHPKLHELIFARAEELGIKVVLGERVKVPEEGFPVDGTEFDVDLLSGSSLRADLVVRASLLLFLSTFAYAPSAQDPCYRPYTNISTPTHTRTRVPDSRRLHLSAAHSATRRPRISNSICDWGRCRYEEPKGGTARCATRPCGSREYRASCGREFRCRAVRVFLGAMEDLHVAWHGESSLRVEI
jgi:hypothetical protein